jgi:hypothetical protein
LSTAGVQEVEFGGALRFVKAFNGILSVSVLRLASVLSILL